MTTVTSDKNDEPWLFLEATLTTKKHSLWLLIVGTAVKAHFLECIIYGCFIILPFATQTWKEMQHRKRKCFMKDTGLKRGFMRLNKEGCDIRI